MNGENQPLVTDKPVEFEKLPVKDFKKITNRFRRIYEIYLKSIKDNRNITTCNRLDLETRGFWHGYPQKSPQRLLPNTLHVPVEAQYRVLAYIFLHGMSPPGRLSKVQTLFK
jgi:hypothetical protein